MSLRHMDASLFGWQSWRAGSICSVLGVRHRTKALLANADALRAYAIGWCDASQVPCRPKRAHYAVMFKVGDQPEFWTHLRAAEFFSIWEAAS